MGQGADNSICVYCGCHIAKQRDARGRKLERNREHAVGRQFFANPRPNDLDKVVVPSCRGCNERDKADEDYVRSIILGFSEAGNSETAGDQLLHDSFDQLCCAVFGATEGGFELVADLHE